MKKTRELKSLDMKQLQKVTGGSGTQPTPWDRSIPNGPNDTAQPDGFYRANQDS
jgi:hypothetical protein